jgi:hypothetical protein
VEKHIQALRATPEVCPVSKLRHRRVTNWTEHGMPVVSYEPCPSCTGKSAQAVELVSEERLVDIVRRHSGLEHDLAVELLQRRRADEAGGGDVRSVIRDEVSKLYRIASALCSTVPDPEFPPRMNREARHKIAKEADIADGQCKGFAIAIGETCKRLSAIAALTRPMEDRRDAEDARRYRWLLGELPTKLEFQTRWGVSNRMPRLTQYPAQTFDEPKIEQCYDYAAHRWDREKLDRLIDSAIDAARLEGGKDE